MVAAVTVLAIALRVLWVLLVPTKPVGDFAMYVESAAHLVEHGSLDAEYVYMPGYVLLIAPVQALGGGWLGTKLVGAVLGGLGAGAVAGIARHIASGSTRVAVVAGLFCAFWPAGIASASVTGTDMPAAVLVVAAVYCLLRFSGRRPLAAAILFGVLSGLAAYIRAVVVPLAALSALVFRAAGNPWRRSLLHAALACGISLVVLSPWAVRNHLRYGETFFTDSHGGLTALVGANPNTDGCYSRSLNRMFHDVTGFALLAEPHRQADRAALAIAKAWTRFDLRYTLGLLAGKAERLLVHERALLYWPLFRAGVLPEPDRRFFAGHQAAIEAMADYFWLVMLALALMGAGIATVRRQWLALSLLPFAAVLVALYSAIFSEPRYRVPICMLLLPLSAYATAWLFQTGRGLARREAAAAWRREAAVAVGLAALLFVAGPLFAQLGQRWRDGHRWAVHECRVAEQRRFCAWRTLGADEQAPRPILRGVWNGVGIAVPPGEPAKPGAVTVETELDVRPGDYTLQVDIDHAHAQPPKGTTLTFLVDDQPLGVPLPLDHLPASERNEPPLAWQAMLRHPGGPLRLRVRLLATAGAEPPGRVWLSNLRLGNGLPF
jgi:hypothetical protein